VTHRWLVLDLCAPLMAFGGVAIDQVGPTRDFPGTSMLAGLLGNALGWHWRDREAHQRLQDRLVTAARLEDEGRPITDVQNARLGKNDRGWTTFGAPEGRAGASYDAPHRRRRDYLADARLLAVLRLAPDEGPSLDELAEALDRPARPLFVGRKPCLPSRRLFAGWTEGDTAHAALLGLGKREARAQWPLGEGPEGDRRVELSDLRNWETGLHGGSRYVIEGRLLARDKAEP
jgi:CRISPR system Cascade subunit CasD